MKSSHRRRPDAARDYTNRGDAANRVKIDKHGMAYIEAFPGQGGARGRFRVTGRDLGSTVNTDPGRGLVGTRRLGTSQVLGEIRPEQSKRGVTLVRPSLTADTPFKPPKTQTAEGGDGSTQAGSEGAAQGDSSGDE